MNYTQYIKPALLVLVPFLIGLGEVVKKWLFGVQALVSGEEAQIKNSRFRIVILKLIPTVKHIPYAIWILAVILASLYGFIISTYTGWRLVIDAMIYTGLVQGSIIGFASMGVFDTLKKKEK